MNPRMLDPRKKRWLQEKYDTEHQEKDGGPRKECWTPLREWWTTEKDDGN
jgi:hypothetical protein